MNRFINLALFVCVLATACEPIESPEIDLGTLPSPPPMRAELLSSNPNAVVIESLDNSYFDEFWSLPGSTTPTSSKKLDTVIYSKKGDHVITLYASKNDQSGTAQNSKTITIDQDLQLPCDSIIGLLTGGCGTGCWTLSPDDGAVMVGPSPLSSEWFSSTGNPPEQDDDTWCFTFDGSAFQYNNQGATFSACQGYIVDPAYVVPTGISYLATPSSSIYSEIQFTFSPSASGEPDSWMGVEDSGPVYEIHSITSTELILLAPTKPCDGAPTNGFFTLTFVKI